MKTTIDMAREAGFTADEFAWHDYMFEHFEALIRADEREQIAQMIEDAPPLVEVAQNDQGGCMMCGFTPKRAAAAIRARNEQ
jgi:hypothetical protein